MEECRALPHPAQGMSQLSLGTRGAFSVSLEPSCSSSCPLCVSASGPGFSIHSVLTWPLSATGTDQGLLVSKFHILGTPDLIAILVCCVTTLRGPPSTWLRLREQIQHRLQVPGKGPNISNYPLGDIWAEYVGKRGWYAVGAQEAGRCFIPLATSYHREGEGNPEEDGVLGGLWHIQIRGR